MQNIDLSKFQRPYGQRMLLYRILWNLVCGIFFRISPRPLWGWRRFLLRLFGARIGSNVRLDPTCSVFNPRNLTIGDNCWIGPYDELYSVDRIEIRDNVALAQHVHLYTASHDIEDPMFPTISSSIIIEDQAWLAADTFVGPGVRIGQGAVLGACSCALSDLPAWHVCVGTPAKPIKRRVLRAGK